jgi:hypothetical protein
MGGFRVRAAAAALSVATLAACSGGDGFLPPNLLSSGLTRAPNSLAPDTKPTRESDKIVQLPARPEDLDCPNVDVTDGGATARVGGASSSEVRYQFDIADVARECDPQGSNFALKVGAKLRLLIGPAGSPGAYSTSVHVLVKDERNGKTAFEKSYSVAVNTAGGDRADTHFVTPAIVLPLTRARLDQDYSIFVSLGGGGGAAVAHQRRAHRG